VEIGDGALLGQNVVVCPGVRIGRGAVVGANSVVRDDIPDRAIAVGAPARVVRLLDGEREPVA
jgi:acetyltransferase-like isoleucine patch superfamily enzyme